MTSVLTKRRLLIGAGLGLAGLVLAGMLARVFLTGLALNALLKEAGATEVTFQVTQVSPWRVVVEDVGFLLRLQPFAAGRVSLKRTHWWTPSLGALRVEQARTMVKLDELVKNQAPAGPVALPADLPFEEISIDGQLVVQAGGIPDQSLKVKIETRPSLDGAWEGTAQVDAPGLALKATARLDRARDELAFTLADVMLDLKMWQGFAQHLAPLPVMEWELEGKLSGSAKGRLAGNKLTGSGNLRLREGRVAYAAKAVTAEGIEADLELVDFDGLMSKPGALRVRELHTGRLTLRNIAAEFTREGTDRVAVARVSLQALGGGVAAEPFSFAPSRAELDAVLLVDGINVEEVMALTQDLPAKATGRVNGRVPVHIDGAGLRFGTGWLALKPGVPAEVQFNARGLLTSGAAAGSPGYSVLQKIESGLLKLKINALRLDIRPTDAPESRSAQLHLQGEPVDPEVKAPVTLDLNVNGPLEKLLNMGMDPRLSLGSGK